MRVESDELSEGRGWNRLAPVSPRGLIREQCWLVSLEFVGSCLTRAKTQNVCCEGESEVFCVNVFERTYEEFTRTILDFIYEFESYEVFQINTERHENGYSCILVFKKEDRE
jgi:hypothetical protein